MAMTRAHGFTLLIAMIFVGVVLAFAATIGALGYKQSILASNAIQSQYAFYAADAGLECALYYDRQAPGQPLSYTAYNPDDPPQIACDDSGLTSPELKCDNGPGCNDQLVLEYEVPLDSDTRCAQISFYEPDPSNPNPTATYLFSQGYNASCEDVDAGSGRIVARGLETYY